MKTKTTYVWRGNGYQSLTLVNDAVHAELDRLLRNKSQAFNMADPRLRSELHDVLVENRKEIMELLSVTYDVEPESIQDSGERSIFTFD